MPEQRTLARGATLVIATHNPGKVAEIADLLAPYGLRVVSAGDLGLSEPAETEATFAGNARIKALAAAEASGLPAVADDSGLEVDVLDGAPGIYSARWAGPDKDFKVAMARVVDEVEAQGGFTSGVPAANFTCALCLAWPDGEIQVFEGRVYGRLVWPPRGTRGFGYDPIFVPEGGTATFGEMEPEAKHAISHRAEAFRLFVAACLAP
jgi:XTP/dITP diphosphohydrolase